MMEEFGSWQVVHVEQFGQIPCVILREEVNRRKRIMKKILIIEGENNKGWPGFTKFGIRITN